MQQQVDIPIDWIGTIPEYYVYRALIQLGYEGRFEYQSSKMGGRQERGGAVVDFFIDELNLALNVASLYWHYQRPEGLRNDQLQREQLEAMGIRMVYIDEEAVLRNARWYVQEALNGNDHSLMSKGI